MAVYVDLTAILDAVMGNSIQISGVEESRFAFVSDDFSYACATSPHITALILGVRTLNDLIKIYYFSLLLKESTNRQSQLDFFMILLLSTWFGICKSRHQTIKNIQKQII